MAKRKTSKKRVATSIEDLPIVKLKKSVKTKKHDPNLRLRNKEFISGALLECLMDGDMDAFLEIIDSHYEAINKTEALKKANLSQRTYYDAVKKGANPTLKTVMKIIKGLNAA